VCRQRAGMLAVGSRGVKELTGLFNKVITIGEAVYLSQ